MNTTLMAVYGTTLLGVLWCGLPLVTAPYRYVELTSLGWSGVMTYRVRKTRVATVRSIDNPIFRAELILEDGGTLLIFEKAEDVEEMLKWWRRQ